MGQITSTPISSLHHLAQIFHPVHYVVVLHFNLLDFAANVIGYSFLISDLLLENGELLYFIILSWHFLVHVWIILSVCLHQSFRRRKSFPWQRDLFEDSLRAAGLTGAENGTKLYVSNLDVGVTNEDIRVQLIYTFLLLCRPWNGFLKFYSKLPCNSGTFLWDWRAETICSSLRQEWSLKCKQRLCTSTSVFCSSIFSQNHIMILFPLVWSKYSSFFFSLNDFVTNSWDICYIMVNAEVVLCPLVFSEDFRMEELGGRICNLMELRRHIGIC